MSTPETAPPTEAAEAADAGDEAADAGEAAPPSPPPPRRRRRVGWVITVVVLSLALVATGALLALALIRLDEANLEIDHQRDLIDKKETFSLAATELVATASQFDGVPYATIVDSAYHASLIGRGWDHRWHGDSLERDTQEVRRATEALAGILSAAQTEAASNATGTLFESLTDQLGTGFVKTSLDTADATCVDDVWGCVGGDDPFTIHYDASQTNGEPYMSDWLRTGLAYHEYAHVLQMTNPGPTETAAEAFGGDWETMADCYALTVLPGWSLDHRIWVSSYEYWDVSVGYGYTCDEGQRQVLRDWVASLGYVHEPITQ